MDPSSVITQVPQNSSAAAAVETRLHQDENADPNANAASAAAAASAAPSHQNAGGGGGGSPSSQMFTVQKNSKKRSNFLCSIICCFGKRGSRRRKSKDLNASASGSGSRGSGGGGGSGGSTGDSADAAGLAGGGVALAKSGGGGVSPSAGGATSSSLAGGAKPLLQEIRPEDAGKKCIVIDLDETLVHSSFKPISNADFIVPVEIDGTIHQVYVLKRPHVDEFLCKMGELFECVLFTASLAKYADPVTDLLDKWDVFHSRLFRESCVFHRGNYVKDLSRLGRELHQILIVDNSPASYIFHPDNAVPVASWFDDMNDRELLDLIPFLENLSKVDSVYGVLQSAKGNPRHSTNGSDMIHQRN